MSILSICNNAKGLQTSKKSLKLLNFFKNEIAPNGILSLQETHTTKVNEIKWKNKFVGQFILFTW